MTTTTALIRRISLFALALALAACAGEMMGDPKVNMRATLNGAQEVPALTVAGTGSATVTLDQKTKTLAWTVNYGGLTGPARAAHFHGPAAAGVNAGVLVPITVAPNQMTGTAQLTDAQIADVLAGKWYINVHTAAHPGGEIRGQVMKAN